MIGNLPDLFYMIWLSPLTGPWNNFAVWFNQF
ncbi:hypothetical protein R1CP_21080 [Rhodococcus opacus]|uniref:Uncharacterized protein n=1 Tax=Rhodococcus opacus TaxID=37919 RepID=A0A1B1K8E3_RHOOP|nr:hypothetical protein R1CP_21080 [Rhodococcus opacus]